MVKLIQKNNKELHQCDECGFQYAEKEWAEKCEAWCKEHKSCNIEITSHAVQETEGIKFGTKFFYGLIGFSASLAFFLALYWSLRLDSSIGSFIRDFKGMPLYFWPYVLLTLGAIALFGVSISLFVYRWRKFGFTLRSPERSRRDKGRAASSGLGSLVGIAASACPVCGSTILSAIGIAGGLTVFPLGGLELKALSVGLLALPIWLMRKDIKKLESDCVNGVCPMPQDPSLKENERHWLIGLLVLTVILTQVAFGMLKTDPAVARLLVNSASVSETGSKLFDEVTAKVLPEKGFQSKVALKDSVLGLVENGVIDRGKFEAIYKDRAGLPAELTDVLTRPSDQPMLLTKANANYYVNLLWPLGLANYMSTNKESPISGKSLFNFASTGGWNLGKEENGGAYFNKFKIVELTPEQEALVTKIAQNTYRPCCNNSTFYQDCNHGSALLGLLQLGASQGLSEDELWREALAFNSFWFPHNYIQTGLYLKAVKNTDWENVDPKEVMGKAYSSASGAGLVAQKVSELGLVPQQQGGGSCGV